MRAARIVAMTAGAALDHWDKRPYLYSKSNQHITIIMANFYRNDEIKFAISLEAPGFSMDDDDFDIEVKSGNSSVKGYKNPEAGSPTDVIIYKDTVTVPPEEGGEEKTVSTWYAIVDTSALDVGSMRVIATAHIVDINANDGVRNCTAVASLGKLVDA